MSDAIDHPSYYNRGSVEVIDFIEDWRLDFSMGNFVKYVCRAGSKDNAVQDLEKAKWYIKRFADHPCEFYLGGTYDWKEYAESLGLCEELCVAMGAAYNAYRGEDVYLYTIDVIFLINKAIDDIKEKQRAIEHGVIETGSEQ